MKATELRIGNLIHDLTLGVCEVRGTGTNCIWISEHGPGIESAFSGIPLNEEWLLKMGFEKNYNGLWCDPIYLRQYDNGCLYLANQRHVNIFYVHQLQNLYYALTGKELLTIK